MKQSRIIPERPSAPWVEAKFPPASAETMVVSTVNVSHWPWWTAEDVAQALREANYLNGHMSAFFLEVKPAHQIEFAQKHGISRDQLVIMATKFRDNSGFNALLAE